MFKPRYELGRKVQERGTYTGTVQNVSRKKAGQHHLCLLNITDENGKIVADHIWFILGKRFQSAGWLRTGDRMQFDARVKTYQKGWAGSQTDYRLSNPTNVRLIARAAGSVTPEIKILEPA
jgi:hypothetical protein